MKYNSSTSDKSLNELTFFISITGTFSALDLLGDKKVLMIYYKGSRVYIARSLIYSSHWIRNCDDTYWTAGLQLPANVKYVLSLGCFMPMWGLNRSLCTYPGGVKHPFSTHRRIWPLK